MIVLFAIFSLLPILIRAYFKLSFFQGLPINNRRIYIKSKYDLFERILESIYLIMLFGGIIIIGSMAVKNREIPLNFDIRQLQYGYIGIYVILQVLTFFKNPIIRLYRNKDYLIFKGFKMKFKLPINSIDYFQINNDELTIYTNDGKKSIEGLKIGWVENMTKLFANRFPEIKI